MASAILLHPDTENFIMNPHTEFPACDEEDIVTPDDLEDLAMSNTSGCDFPIEANDEPEIELPD